ncbi:MAG: tripartite tricarboxylate transporter permease [Thermoanaerobacteraceae bacterium]|nr:tripartite tricarboxylate transporter permease [Thermoanaerobacteraceae bacterium]
MDTLVQSIEAILTPGTLLTMTIGMIGGIIAGFIPGFTITMAVALTLPFTFGMDPIQGIATMMAVDVGANAGGLISACLLGIPGTPSTIATVYDGYPMAKRGEGGRAITIGLMSNAAGVIISGIFLILLAVPLSQMALLFGPWEYFSLMVFGLSAIISLSEGSLVKGIISGIIGLLTSMVGMDPLQGIPRLTFGNASLAGGFNFLPVLVGVFAFSELMDEVNNPRYEKLEFDKKANVSYPWIKAIKELVKNWWTVLYAAIIGTIVGALPAAGGSIANVLAYNEVKASSKEPEKFGTGIPEGIMASEAGHASCTGGALIPMLAFGIPGDVVTAMMLGALIIHGIQPGPMLMTSQPVLGYSVYVSFFISGILMVIIQGYGARFFLRINDIPKNILVPLILLLCAVGSFAVNNRVFDIWVLLWFGILGYLLKKTGFPLAPLILGNILGPMAETNLRRALMTSNNLWLFVTRPISLLFLLFALLSVIYPFYRNYKRNRLAKQSIH